MHKSINWQAVSFDWNQVRAFLAAIEEGSLSAAARALGQTQPTLSRQISALESSLGVLLLERGTRGLTLTDAGGELLEQVRVMGNAAMQLSLTASGQSRGVEGQVSITSTNAFATFHLPRILSHLRKIAPLIDIEIVPSNDVRDITRREADIAIRHARPTQLDLIGKHVGDMFACLYASRDYLDRVGRPGTLEDCNHMDFIGFESKSQMLPVLNSMGLALTEKNFRLLTPSGNVILALVRQGLGISILTHDAERLFPDIERVLPDLDPMPIPIWLVTHRELRTSQRIRIVFDCLAEQINANELLRCETQ